MEKFRPLARTSYVLNTVEEVHTTPIFKSLNNIPLNSLYYYRIGLLMHNLSVNCDRYHIQTNVLKLYLHNNEVILKYNKQKIAHCIQ